jgi:hypothetical protein
MSDNKVNFSSNDIKRRPDYLINVKKHSLHPKAISDFLWVGSHKFATIGVAVLVLAAVAVPLILGMESQSADDTAQAPEEPIDMERERVKAKKREIAEKIKNITGTASAEPVIVELNGLIDSLYSGRTAPSKYAHADERDYNELKAEALMSAKNYSAAVEVINSTILAEGDEKDYLFELYNLLADAYRGLGSSHNFDQLSALKTAVSYADNAADKPSDTELYSVESYVRLLESQNIWS